MISGFSTALIGAFSILAVHSVICSLSGPLSHGSPIVVFFDGGHPRFWNFYSTFDVVRVRSLTLFRSRVACIRCCGHALKRRRSRYGRVECFDRAP